MSDPVQSPRALAPEWASWLEESIQRGCAAESVIDAMADGGMDRESAAVLVYRAISRHASRFPPQPARDYTFLKELAKLALPDSEVLRITEGPRENSTSGLIELHFLMDAALSPEHPAYRAPESGAGPFRARLSLGFNNAREVRWLRSGPDAGKPAAPMGGIDAMTLEDGYWEIVGSWGHVLVSGSPQVWYGPKPDWARNDKTYFEISPEAPAVSGNYRDEEHGRMLELDFVYSVRSEIITSLGTYAVTIPLADALRDSGMTGFEFVPATTSIEDYVEDPQELDIPELYGMWITGTAFIDDFGLTPKGDLVLTQRAKELLTTRDPNLSAEELDWTGRSLFIARSFQLPSEKPES
ncbi:hypothetical protein GPX89_07545 [Nocardia sp. ET3-3]|uniref:Uncharacterized protein n=1 Tax=Nocardia terrae TaxID=2675851 RepID=A0A7K1URX4_9NOCA|nr:hypothetical protein [Nocardia terrae]MVU77100.1 hypothetical protein [Nocardia terrae]